MNDQMQSDAGFIERVALMLACSNPVYIHSQQLCGSDIKSALSQTMHAYSNIWVKSSIGKKIILDIPIEITKKGVSIYTLHQIVNCMSKKAITALLAITGKWN